MYYNINTPSVVSKASSAGIWIVISAVIAIMGGIIVYFMFLTKSNEDKLEGKAKWLYDFLSFKKLFAEMLLKIAYLITAIYITLSSFAFISTNFVLFIVYLLVGNVVARICYEFALAMLLICKNTTEINSKLKQIEEPKAKAAKKETKEDK